MLARHFIERLSHELGKEVGDITESALKLLLDYDWPGNLRELENAVERAIVTCRTGVLTFCFFESQQAGVPRLGRADQLDIG